jgi:hypothetical protein
MDMFSFMRFCLRTLADPNEIIRRMKRNVILTIAIKIFYQLIAYTIRMGKQIPTGSPPWHL